MKKHTHHQAVTREFASNAMSGEPAVRPREPQLKRLRPEVGQPDVRAASCPHAAAAAFTTARICSVGSAMFTLAWSPVQSLVRVALYSTKSVRRPTANAVCNTWISLNTIGVFFRPTFVVPRPPHICHYRKFLATGVAQNLIRRCGPSRRT